MEPLTVAMHEEEQVNGSVVVDQEQSITNTDNSIYGDDITELQEDQYFKLGFLNVNGLHINKWKEKTQKYSKLSRNINST